jgi:hypothetical protein
MTLLPGPWQEALATLADPGVTAVVAVQCDLDWLRPGSAALRDEIDDALTMLALAGRAARIDRIMLHSLPAVGDVPLDELAELNGAHADWIDQLRVVAVLLPEAIRPRVHRVIVGGGQHSVGLVDSIELQVNGAWAHLDAVEAALAVVRRAGATTPLTGYDVEMDGPFGDADPSVYL